MILEIYRGYTITDEPNGCCPFSIYDEAKNILLDTDSETIEQVRVTVDNVADEKEAEETEKQEQEFRSRYRNWYEMKRDMCPGF